MVVERITKKPCYEEIERRILAPLELFGIVPQDSRDIPGLVPGYLGLENPFHAPDKTLDADERFFLNPQFEWAGGGFADNGGALARWAKALYEGPLLEPETRAKMVAGKDASRELGPGMRYGLACEIGSTSHGEAWGHAGFFPGYLTEMRYWPEHRIAVAVQVNTSEYAALPHPLGALCEELLGVALEPDGG